VVATSPETAELYRMDLLVAAAAGARLWLTDAYFLATPPYRQALRAAALDGVDVRLLLPHGSDIEWIANLSRMMYRSLLEAGVRIFEWNGSMMHAKTAVADGRWARIGSTNLNVASWIGNWELDVAVEDAPIAREMEQIFLDDLRNSTEIVLTRRRHRVRPRPAGPVVARAPSEAGSGSRVLTNAATLTGVLGAAVRGHRTLVSSEASWLLVLGVALLVLAAVAVVVPRVLAATVAGALTLVAVSVLVRASRLRWGRRKARG
jgi:cardiolipin synthase